MRKMILLLFFIFSFTLVRGQEVSSNIRTLLSTQGKVLFGDEPNSIVVIDYPDNLKRIEEYLSAVDVSPQQVLIEARVVEVKLQKEHSLGVNWQFFAQKNGFKLGTSRIGSTYPGAPGLISQAIDYKTTYYPPGQTTSGAESPFSIAIFDDNVNIVLKTLATNLDTDILSAPRVTTVNNREAEIKIIQKIPWAEPEVEVSDSGTVTVTWTVNFEEVGITLKVTPTINENGTITMVLAPEVSEKTSDYTLQVTQGSTSVPYTVPIIDKRTATTKVVIGNKQTLIIGGLIKDKVTEGETKIPILGDLPAFGYLFKSKKVTKDKTELLIFVSPTIITQDEFASVEKQERYGIGRKFIQERERQDQMALLLENQEKKTFERISSQLDNLTRRQQELVIEREKLESEISERQQKVEALQEDKDSLVEKRRELENK